MGVMVNCVGIGEWTSCGALIWFGQVMRTDEDDFVRRVYMRATRGKPPVKRILNWRSAGEKKSWWARD